MRVLLISQFPLSHSGSGRHAQRIATALHAAGHSPRVLIAADGEQPPERFPTSVVHFRPNDSRADAPISLPRFSASPDGRAFSQLSEAEIASYRDAMRRRLDAEVAEFDPQVIHAQHVWLAGQLALESGVPYFLTAWAPELDAAADPRYQSLADQAAENASRILAVDAAVERRLRLRYEGLVERLECVAPAAVETGDGFDLVARYQAALRERFGD